eukprot:m.18052 g.18052  ORF g.18052 m.18052 type:complete len:97 (+) comp7664_c0_seq2:405-695(+)
MASLRTPISTLLSLVARRSLHTSTVAAAGQKYRLSKGVARSGNEYGPLTDGPDWTYEDTGVAAPQTTAQMKRAREQEAQQARIAQLLREINSTSQN